MKGSVVSNSHTPNIAGQFHVTHDRIQQLQPCKISVVYTMRSHRTSSFLCAQEEKREQSKILWNASMLYL